MPEPVHLTLERPIFSALAPGVEAALPLPLPQLRLRALLPKWHTSSPRSRPWSLFWLSARPGVALGSTCMGGRCYGLPSSRGHRLRALLFVACCGFWAWTGFVVRTYGEGAGIPQAGPQGTHPGQDAPEGSALTVVESAAPECKSTSSSCQPSLPECATATGPSSPHTSHAEAISSMVFMVQPPREERSPVLLQVQLAARGHLHGRSCEASLAVPGQSMETTIAQVEKAAVP